MFDSIKKFTHFIFVHAVLQASSHMLLYNVLYFNIIYLMFNIFVESLVNIKIIVKIELDKLEDKKNCIWIYMLARYSFS